MLEFRKQEVNDKFALKVKKDFSVVMNQLKEPYAGPVSNVTLEGAEKLVEEGHPWIEKKKATAAATTVK